MGLLRLLGDRLVLINFSICFSEEARHITFGHRGLVRGLARLQIRSLASLLGVSLQVILQQLSLQGVGGAAFLALLRFNFTFHILVKPLSLRKHESASSGALASELQNALSRLHAFGVVAEDALALLDEVASSSPVVARLQSRV